MYLLEVDVFKTLLSCIKRFNGKLLRPKITLNEKFRQKSYKLIRNEKCKTASDLVGHRFVPRWEMPFAFTFFMILKVRI